MAIHGGDIYADYKIKYANSIIDFSANLNPLGMPEEIKKALSAAIESCESYPDTKCRELKKTIAKKEGVREDYIFCGNGAADVIYRLVAGLKPVRALIAAPTFSEYEDALRSVGCEILLHFTNEENGFALDDDFIEKIHAVNMVFLCNPNNPTGRAEKCEYVRKVIEKAKECGAVAVIDECFMDFVENAQEFSVQNLLEIYPELVVLRSFTKMYSMAGIRLGYMFCSDISLIKKTESSGQVWNVSTPAQKCGVAACAIEGFEEKSRAYVSSERTYLTKELEKRGLKVFEGRANYIFFKCEDEALYEKLLEYGLIIRRCSNYHGLNSKFYRVAVRTHEENLYLIETLKKLTETIQ